jgi:glycosyltransferase involved in cell wall biosynthesis
MNSNMNSVKAAVYTPYIYRWMLDFVHELSDSLGEVRFYSRGIYGNYPWTQYEQYARLMNKQHLLSAVIDYLRYRPDFIILLGSETLLSLILYLLSKIVRTNPVLIVEENRERVFASVVLRYLARLKRLFVVATHRNADVLVAESEPAKEYLLRMGCAPERIHVIPHGTNMVDFQPRPRSEQLARLLGLSANDLRASIILFVGEFSEYKGAEFMAQTILTFTNPGEAIFLIPSQGSIFLQHESQFNEMKNVYAYSSLDDECMPYLYNLCDIVVVPSKLCDAGSSDRSPNSLIEAMACGKAVIGTAVGGIPTIMDQAGLLIQPNDPAAIVQAISQLIVDTRLRETLGKEARTRAVTTLNNHVYARCIFELWKQAAHG